MTDFKWQLWAAKSIFFIGGFGAATWAPIVPLLKRQMMLSDDIMGILLLGIGIGSLVTMPFSGAAASHWGCRKVLTVISLFYAMDLLFLCEVGQFWLAFPLVLVLGALMGGIDVVVNVLAVKLEQNSGKRLMSGMHAFWSVGCFVGAGIFSIWLSLGFSYLLSTLIAAAIIVLLLMIFGKHLLSEKGPREKNKLIAIPHGVVIFVGIAAFISFLAEGSMLDWGGIMLTENKGMDLSMASTGYAVFAGAMFLMRLLGDSTVNYLGGKLVTVGGSLLSLVGLLSIILSENNIILYAGFFLMGIGTANIVPVFFSMMGQQNEMPVANAVAAAGSMGYLGMLIGPACIGFISEATNLCFGLGFVAVLLLIQMFISRYVYKKVLR